MNRLIAVLQLSFVTGACPTFASGATPTPCPIELVVGQIHRIDGDKQAVHLHRGTQTIPVSAHTCLLYGDQLEAGQRAEVTFDTEYGLRHVGRDWAPVWNAPQAQGTDPPEASALLSTLYHGLIDPAEHRSSYATSRGLELCTRPNIPPALTALDRLRQTDQQIGSDLRAIVAAWTPTGEPHDVRARLIGNDGVAVVQNHTCFDSHIVLTLPDGALRPGKRFALEITDDSARTLRYNVLVIEPAHLPQPPIKIRDEWLLAAWRVAAGPPEARLDSIARLQMAPPGAFGAPRILEAIWSDRSF